MAYCCYYAELTRGVKGKVPSLLISCKEMLLREMPTGKETKKVELSRNNDVIISPFLFCFSFIYLFIYYYYYYYYYYFDLDCFVLFCFFYSHASTEIMA